MVVIYHIESRTNAALILLKNKTNISWFIHKKFTLFKSLTITVFIRFMNSIKKILECPLKVILISSFFNISNHRSMRIFPIISPKATKTSKF